MGDIEPIRFGPGPKDWIVKPRMVEVIRRSLVDVPLQKQPTSFRNYTQASIVTDEEHRAISLGKLSQHPEHWLESILTARTSTLPNQVRIIVMQSTIHRGIKYEAKGATITTDQCQDLLDKSLDLYGVDKDWFYGEVNEASGIATAQRIGKSE